MQLISEMLLPISRGRPSKLRDRGLAKIVQGGYGLWNPNDEKLILLPAGVKLFRHVQNFLLDALSDFRPQLIDTNGSSRGSLDAAVRTVKRAGDLPLLLAARQGDELELLGLHTDLEASMEMANDAIRATGRAISELNARPRRVDRLLDAGHAVDLFCKSDEPLQGEDGLFCATCGWLVAPDSPFRGPENSSDVPQQELKEVETPNCSTIEDLCAFLKISPSQTVKCMIYAVEGHGLTAVILRGDRQVCLQKVRAAFRGAKIRPAEPDELMSVMGDSAGYMGPVGLPEGVTLLADYSVVGVQNSACGANKKGFHLTGACWNRDFKTELVTDLALVQEGDICPRCGDALKKTSLRRVARFFPIDPICAAENSLSFFNGQKKLHVPAWSASIDLTSLLSAVIEDTKFWPREIAPYDDYVFCDDSSDVYSLVGTLEKKGRSVIVDDRRGIKFSDRVADAASFAAPEILGLKNETDVSVVQIFSDGAKETIPTEDFLARLR